MIDFFSLPGPRRFIEAVSSSIRDGNNVVVAIPMNLPEGLFDAIAREIAEYCGWARVSNDLDTTTNPCSALETIYLRDALPDRCATPVDIARIPQISGGVQHVVPEESSEKSWLDFLTDYERACRDIRTASRPLFCIQLPRTRHRVVKEDVCLRSFRWEAIVSLNDMRFFADSIDVPFNVSPIMRKIILEIAVQIAAWDTVLCQLLLNFGNDVAKRTMYVLKEILDTSDGHVLDDEELYKLGLVDVFDSERKKHIKNILADRELEELNLRIWKAELTVLMPFIEEERIRLIKEIGARLKLPHEIRFGNPIENPLDLEYSHLNAQIKWFDIKPTQTQRDRIKLYLAIRNSLAHMEPLNGIQIDEFERLAKVMKYG